MKRFALMMLGLGFFVGTTGTAFGANPIKLAGKALVGVASLPIKTAKFSARLISGHAKSQKLNTRLSDEDQAALQGAKLPTGKKGQTVRRAVLGTAVGVGVIATSFAMGANPVVSAPLLAYVGYRGVSGAVNTMNRKFNKKLVTKIRENADPTVKARANAAYSGAYSHYLSNSTDPVAHKALRGRGRLEVRRYNRDGRARHEAAHLAGLEAARNVYQADAPEVLVLEKLTGNTKDLVNKPIDYQKLSRTEVKAIWDNQNP